MSITNYSLSESLVKHFAYDSTYLWIAYETKLQKVSANNPLQLYYDIDIAVTAIKKLFVYSTYIYLATNDITIIGKRYSLTNPLTTSNNFNVPAGLSEEPVDVISDGTYAYFLTPGDLSGTNAKIYKYLVAGTYHSTIDLATVTNAKSFSFDSNNEIRVVTFNTPAEIVRVYNLSTTPAYTVTQITD